MITRFTSNEFANGIRGCRLNSHDLNEGLVTNTNAASLSDADVQVTHDRGTRITATVPLAVPDSEGLQVQVDDSEPPSQSDAGARTPPTS